MSAPVRAARSRAPCQLICIPADDLLVKCESCGSFPDPARRLGLHERGLRQNDAPSASLQWRKVADQLRPELPKRAGLPDEVGTDVLAYMTFRSANNEVVAFLRKHRVEVEETRELISRGRVGEAAVVAPLLVGEISRRHAVRKSRFLRGANRSRKFQGNFFAQYLRETTEFCNRFRLANGTWTC
jgi:hypothetical protein